MGSEMCIRDRFRRAGERPVAPGAGAAAVCTGSVRGGVKEKPAHGVDGQAGHVRFFFAVLTEAIQIFSAPCICRAFVHLPGKEKYRPSRRTIGIFGGGRWISPDGDKLRLHLPRKEKYQSPQKGNWYFWWGKMDSNHRRHCQQIYSLSPLATREFPHMQFCQKVELVDGLEPPTC